MRQLLRQCLWALWPLLLTTSLGAQDPAVEDSPPTPTSTSESTSESTPESTPESVEDVPPEDTAPSLPGQFRVELDRQEITVGDRVKATLTLVWMGAEPTAPARFPTWQETWGGAEVLESSPVEAFVDQSGRHIFRQELRLTAFEVGEVRLPSVEVALPFAERTVDLRAEGTTTFEVVSVLPPEPETAAGAPGSNAPGFKGGSPPAGGAPGTTPGTTPDGAPAEPPEPPELRPPAPPQALPPRVLFWWTTGLLALACGLATLAVDRRLGYIPEQALAAAPLLPPYDELVKRLTELDPSDTEPTHTALSFGLRRYLGRSLGFQATESTTSEIQRRLRDTSVGAAGVHPLVQLFRACDQVKFARQQVPPEVTRERMRQARQLAQDLEERLRPQAEEITDSGDHSANPATPPQGRAA